MQVELPAFLRYFELKYVFYGAGVGVALSDIALPRNNFKPMLTTMPLTPKAQELFFVSFLTLLPGGVLSVLDELKLKSPKLALNARFDLTK